MVYFYVIRCVLGHSFVHFPGVPAAAAGTPLVSIGTVTVHWESSWVRFTLASITSGVVFV